MPTTRGSGHRRVLLLATTMLVLSACNRTDFVSGWVPYWNATEGRAGFSSEASPMFSDISPFFYRAQADGTVTLAAGASANQLNTTAHEAHIRGIKVLPTITDGSGTLVMATSILADPTARAQHINNIVALTANPEVDGIDLDYEGFAFSDGHDSWASTQPVWRAFVAELAAALHANSKLLAVTVPPTWNSGGVTGYPVYDIGGIVPYVDRLRLMVYDWSVSSPGPISPLSWLNQVITYTNSVVPAAADRAKLQLGVPSYGRDWGRQTNAAEACPDGALATKSIELQNMPALINARGVIPTRHDQSGEMTFTYDTVATGYRTTPIPAPPYVPPPVTQRVTTIPGAAIGATSGLQPALRLTPPTVQLSCAVRHFVYYPDATAIQQHAQAAIAAGWSGIVIWALGYETADVYNALSTI